MKYDKYKRSLYEVEPFYHDAPGHDCDGEPKAYEELNPAEHAKLERMVKAVLRVVD